MRPYISWPSGFNIAPAKITGYLLNLSGGSPAKARWWLSQGFDPDRPGVLIEALFEHTSATNFVGLRLPPKMWGHRLVFEGPIRTPLASNPEVRSIWQVSSGTPSGIRGVAELVTAHRI
ncbi:DUF6883 domain-containing protein [Methylobacterium brachiatum]|uniref:DUF6883 domain-containing protein n=1 Tax=Methylobacterium brachiatum TaxID=269660 RepID=UPI0008E0BE81|nr:DUF6883 domain-containing protein [Methylobacterium brachiatum]MDH2308186.1 hypothetical protein [Methylobacterium brachiatum]SFI64216.1 hypothetical protein SAMN02799642_02390 [Methylobacterium brachiatum]